MVGSFTRHKLIDYCIDASEIKSREKLGVRFRVDARPPLFCQSRTRAPDGAPYWNYDVGWTLGMELD